MTLDIIKVCIPVVEPPPTPCCIVAPHHHAAPHHRPIEPYHEPLHHTEPLEQAPGSENYLPPGYPK